jgi:hypothetical protein
VRLLAALTLAACGAAPAVERAYDGRVVQGHFVGPEAYAAFLQGVIADAAGDARAALAAYGEAARLDPEGPEVWTRIATVRCAAAARDARADEALARAFAADATYARAWEAKARCASLRGDEPGATAAARRAAELDPSADGANVLLARAAVPGDAAQRNVLVALTVTAHDPLIAWDALATWAEAHGDVALWARALGALAVIAPERRDAIARAAEELAGMGEIGEARSVAAAAADAGEGPLAGDRHPLAARLAIDEAVGRRDAEATRRRSTRVRITLDEAAGRALLAGDAGLARELVAVVVRADATATGAALVLAAAEGRDVVGAVSEAQRGAGVPVSGSTWVAFGVALAHAASPREVRAALGSIAHGAVVAGDDRVVRPAVQLVSRGALGVDALPADGLVELALVRGEVPDAPRALDARHEYLALAIAFPRAPRARDLGQRLARVAARDAVVAAASALLGLALGAPVDRAAPPALLARDPADPLLAAAALRLAEKLGDVDVARRARASLAASGGASLQPRGQERDSTERSEDQKAF